MTFDMPELPELPENYVWRASVSNGKFRLTLSEVVETRSLYFSDADEKEIDTTVWNLYMDTEKLVKEILIAAETMREHVLASISIRDAINKESTATKTGVEINGR